LTTPLFDIEIYARNIEKVWGQASAPIVCSLNLIREAIKNHRVSTVVLFDANLILTSLR
jgi:hypothetical protein